MWTSVIPWPYRMLIVVVLVIAGAVSGYIEGLTRASSTCEINNAHAQQASQAKADEETTRREKVAQGFEGTRETVRTVYVTIEKEAKKNVEKNADAYAGCGLDADGLRIWNAANAGDAEALRSGAASGVPGTGTGGIGQPGRLVPQPHPGDAAAQGMSRKTESTSGMRGGE